MNIIPLRVALAQINVTVGDLEGNARKILAAMQQASAADAHIVCVRELALAVQTPQGLAAIVSARTKSPGGSTRRCRLRTRSEQVVEARLRLPFSEPSQ